MKTSMNFSVSDTAFKSTNKIKIPVYATKNLLNYTYNSIPRTTRIIKRGKENGKKIADEKNYGRIKSFFTKSVQVCKSLGKESNPLELPVILSVLALPVTPVGGSPIAFCIGCVLVTPVIIKKLITKELKFGDIKEFAKNMCTKDYIKPDEAIKEKINKLKSFTKLNK